MKICIVGTGYVGLVTGTCFAETGVSVTCLDIDEKKITDLNKGIIPIYEPGLGKMIERNVAKKRLFFSTSLKDNLSDCEAVFIAVGTPSDEDGNANLQYVLSVAREIGRYINNYKVIVTKSTVPLGTSIEVKKVIKEELKKRKSDIQFDIASNPEFLKEGDAIEDFLRPDRIIIGIESTDAEKILNRLYKPFVLNGHPIISMDILSAELTKYAANSMLATKISFMNDIANLCEKVGADVNMVRKGIGSDTRIGNKFIYPGTGYGGSCFPKDVKALIKTADESGHSLKIIKAVEQVNEYQKASLFRKVYSHFKEDIKNKQFALWGLSFKPNTNDMREAPSLVIINKILSEGGKITAYDPVAIKEAKKILGSNVKYALNQYDCLKGAEALIVVTEWSEFRNLNYSLMENQMNNKLIFDGRNIYDPAEMKEFGFTYYSIGRKTIIPK